MEEDLIKVVVNNSHINNIIPTWQLFKLLLLAKLANIFPNVYMYS